MSAWHRRRAAGAVGARRSRCAALPLPRLALYDAWQRLRHPRVERATGPVDLVHSTAHVAAASRGADGGHRARPALPPRARPLHPRGASRCSPASSTSCGTRRPSSCARRRPPGPTARRPASTRRRLRVTPWGTDRRAGRDRRGGAGAGRLRARPARSCCSPAPSSPGRTWPACSRPSTGSATSTPTSCWSGPEGWSTDLPADAGAPAARLRARTPTATRSTRRPPWSLPEPAGGLRAAGARGHGAGRGRGHLGHDLHRRGGRRRRPARRPARRRRHRRRHRSGCSTTPTLRGAARARPPGRGRPPSPGPARPRRRSAPTATPSGAGREPATVGINLLWLVPAGRRAASSRPWPASAACIDLGAARPRPAPLRARPPSPRPTRRSWRAARPRWRRSRRSRVRRVVAESTWLAAPDRGRSTSCTTPAARCRPGGARPCVLTLHDLQPLEAPGHPLGGQAGLPRPRRAAASVARRAGVVAVPSEFVRRHGGRARSASTRTRVVVDPARACRCRPAGHARATCCAARYGLDGPGGPVPGHHLPPQEPPHARRGLRAGASAAPRRRCSCSPGGAGRARRAVRPADRPRSASTTAVRRLGRVPEADVAGLLRPGRPWSRCRPATRASGCRPLEAMAAGVPVVAADATALPEVVGDAGVLVAAGRRRRPGRRPSVGLLDDPERAGPAWPAPAGQRAAGFIVGGQRRRASPSSTDGRLGAR